MKQITLLIVCLNLFQLTAYSQKTISGVVRDKNGEPLIGATVAEEGTNNGAITNNFGNYTITLQGEKEAVLKFSFIGFQEQEILVDNRTTINVSLQEEVQYLEEVVAIGYQTTTRKDVTTAISSVKAEVFEERAITSVEEVLQGTAPGVEVVTGSGEPGSSPTVTIRGTSSMLASSAPLYIVDGVPVDEIDFIPPNEIKDIQILKDASSTAIYGARASNGVVLITTLSGEKGKTKITYNSFLTIQEKPKRIGVLNSTQYDNLIAEAIWNGLDDDKKSGLGYTVWRNTDYLNNYMQLENYRDETGNFLYNTDWQDEVFRTAAKQNHQLTMSSGTDKLNYFLSLTYLNDKGIIEKTQYDRFNLRFKINANLTNWFDLFANITFTKAQNDKVKDLMKSALLTPPFIPVYNEDGTFGSNPLSDANNPVAEIYGKDNIVDDHNYLANIRGEIKIMKGLQYKPSFSYTGKFSRNEIFIDPFSTEYGREVVGEVSVKNTFKEVYNVQNLFTYNKKVLLHSFNLLLGHEAEFRRTEISEATGRGLPNSTNKSISNAATIISATDDFIEAALLSHFASIRYDYNKTYYATFNIRRDGSSRFGRSNQFAVFPSVSLAWRASNLTAIKKIKHIISDLKIRGGYGETGNQKIEDYKAYMLYTFGANYPIGGTIYPGAEPKQFGLPDLKWESSKQFNGGIDVGLFKNGRIWLTVDGYHIKTEDMLVAVNLERSNGVDYKITTNMGSLENYGWEMEVQSKNIVKGKFKWDTNLNLSANRNKVLSIKGGDNDNQWGGLASGANQMRVGYPLGIFWGRTAIGIDEEGNVLYDDSGQDMIGDPNPKLTGGMTNNFTYKNITLSIFLQGAYDFDIYNSTYRTLIGMRNYNNQHTDALGRWKENGANTNLTIPRPEFIADVDDIDSDEANNYSVSTRFIEDASFLRIKNITLSYRFNKKITKHLKVNGLRIYCTVTNLYTFTNYTGNDPEINWGAGDGNTNYDKGIDSFNYPITRSYTLGLNFNF